MSVKFCSIASGSSGNCIYVATDHTRILIDAGISGKKIEAGLAALSESGEKIDALFITHEHMDHIKGAGIFSRRFDIPIYATMGTWQAMESQLGHIIPQNKRFVYEEEACVINDICVKPFQIPHDAAEPVGYRIETEKTAVAIATDIGHVTETVKENISGCKLILLEANHDEEMVKKGSYPWHLKQRILGAKGHLSNHTAGALLSEVMSGKTEHVFLGHLSDENNTPHLAFDTVEQVLRENKIQVGTYLKMDLALRHSNSHLVEL